MKSKTLFGCLLLTVLLAASCEEPFLGNYYGTKEHVYIAPNVFDSTTSVRLVATWDVNGKARLSSSLIPRDTLAHQNGVFVDMPATEYDAKELSITPQNANVSTICISYDAEGNISQRVLPVGITLGLCCYNICSKVCTCAKPIKNGIQWYCSAGIGCQGCCQLGSKLNCMPRMGNESPHMLYFQGTGLGSIAENHSDKTNP